MRIALLSDVHGNSIALDAVLADIQAQGGVDAYWVLGDLAALGYDPAGALERLASLPNVCFARGNTDRYVTTGEQPQPAAEEVRDDPRALQVLVEVVGSFAWTKGAVTATGWLDWLGQLQLEQRLVLPDGTRLLGVHAAPGADDGLGIYPTMSDAELPGGAAGLRSGSRVRRAYPLAHGARARRHPRREPRQRQQSHGAGPPSQLRSAGGG